MNLRTLRVIEYNKIVEMLTTFASSPMAKRKCQRIKPRKDLAMIETLQQETRDALRRLNTQGNLSFAGLKDIGASLKRLEVEGILTTAELLDVASMLDLAATAKRYGENEGTSMTDTRRRSKEQIEEASRKNTRVTGIPTGFIDLDNMLTGLHGSEFILVAARPAMGKTAFVLNIAHHVAVRKGIATAIFNLEMSKEQLVTRMIAMDSLVDSQKVQTGQLAEDDWDQVLASAESIAAAPLYIEDSSALTISELRSKCRQLKSKNNLGLIIIDYLQLMSTTGRVESRQQFVSDMSRSLKMLARELDVPIIALSQLNREVDKRPDHKPVLADLRESGSIEQDADVVMFIYRDDYYNPDTDKKGISEIIIAKQRKGATGSVDLVWLQEYTKFANKEH